MNQRQLILDVIAHNAQRDPASLNDADTLSEIGIDSLRFITMMLDVERLLGRKVFTIDTVGKLERISDILALGN